MELRGREEGWGHETNLLAGKGKAQCMSDEECYWKQWWVHGINPEAYWPTSLDKGRGYIGVWRGVALRASMRSGGPGGSARMSSPKRKRPLTSDQIMTRMVILGLHYKDKTVGLYPG